MKLLNEKCFAILMVGAFALAGLVFAPTVLGKSEG